MREMVREGVIDKVALLETSSALSVSTAHQTGPREVLLGAAPEISTLWYFLLGRSLGSAAVS
jgi:hypothetical protein